MLFEALIVGGIGAVALGLAGRLLLSKEDQEAVEDVVSDQVAARTGIELSGSRKRDRQSIVDAKTTTLERTGS